MKSIKWFFTGMLFFCISFVLASCGGGGGGGGGGGSAPATTYTISGTVTSAPTGSALAGVTMSLISSSGTVTTITAANGTYSFSGLANGTYTVTPSKSGYAFNPLNYSVTVSGANVTGKDFTATAATTTYSISGTVSGATTTSVTMSLSGPASGTVTTDSSGNYTFTGLLNGTYTVTPSKSGYTFSPPNRSVTVSSADVTGQNFTATAIPTTFVISGTITVSGGGALSGATVNLTGAGIGSTTTDSNGNYTFTGLSNGNYTVTPSLTGYTFNPTNRSVTVSSADVTGQNFTATALTYSISGTVSGATTTSVTMTLTGDAGATTTTNSGGNYTFTGLSNGNYTVTPSKTGYTFSPTSTLVTISNANKTGINFVSSSVVTPTYSISGYVNLSGGGALPGVTVTLSGGANGTTTTNASGAYTFNNLVAGTYTVAPSLTGYTIPPASVTITNANMTQNFTADSTVPSYSISGTVNYSGSKTGRIYVTVEWSDGSSTSYGTSIAAPGSFTIRGVSNGMYKIYAWMDTLNNGIQNVANPSGRSLATYTVNNGNITGASVTMNDPVVPLPTTPTGVGAFPMPNGAVVLWDTVPNPAGNGTGATAYKIYWGTDGSTFPNSVMVSETDNGVYFHSGLTNGDVLYYKVSSLINSVESAPSAAVGPITIGAPAGGVSVSGQVSFSGSAAGHRLWVVLVDMLNGQFFGANVLDPISPYNYTISGVQPGNYFLFAFVDMDDNGFFTPGDKLPQFDLLPRFTVAGSPLTGKNVTLPVGNSSVGASTIHSLNGTNHEYRLRIALENLAKRVVKATVMSGLNIPLPSDIGNSWGKFEGNYWLGTTAPTVGDAYVIDVTYSDGTSESLTASVTGVLGTANMATPASPTGTGASITPTFTWTAPVTPPTGVYTYDVGIRSLSSWNWIWSYPNSGPHGGMPSTQTSVPYNVDGNASLTSLDPGTSYQWWITVSDSNGNQAVNYATFTTAASSSVYSITGTITNNNANQTSNILIGACNDAGFTVCNYVTAIPGGAGGAYTISNVPAGTYYVGACIDTNGDMACDLINEPGAASASNPVTITNANRAGIDITIP